MLRWLSKAPERRQETKAFISVTEGLQRLYRECLLPIERDHAFHHFYSPELTDADFSSKPLVLLLGQYSTGKSSFIRHLLGRDYPGLHIGPEPTTDKFVAIVYGDKDQTIPGAALVTDRSLPFQQLGQFGNNFLGRFECARMKSPVLEGVGLLDTPGVLAGEKQRIKRGYEYEVVAKWFADRVDMIILLFDVSKMDISDEFRRVITAVKGNENKIHIVLNKADRVTTPQLMRVYGAMMWNLGKVIDTPEVSRVFIGSFWDEPLVNDEQRRLFESEENELYASLAQLPRGAATRKINDLIKRARLAKVHAYVMEHLRQRMNPKMGMGCMSVVACSKEKRQDKIISDLNEIYEEVAAERHLSLGDFPEPHILQEKLGQLDFKKFARVNKKRMEALDRMMGVDIPKLMALLPAEFEQATRAELPQVPEASPFQIGSNWQSTSQEAIPFFQSQWLQPPDPEEYRADFVSLLPAGRTTLPGAVAKGRLIESKLPSTVLHKIWTLADIDQDGALTLYEFSLAMHFVRMKLDGQDLPKKLPADMRRQS